MERALLLRDLVARRRSVGALLSTGIHMRLSRPGGIQIPPGRPLLPLCRREQVAELERRAKLVEPRAAPAQAPEAAAASTLLSPEEKVSLFRDLFRGREDVYAERFVAKKTGKAGYGPVCANKFVKGLCELPKVKCGACANRALRPLDDRAVDGHLRGDHVLGIYPLLEDETCRLLAMDFDKSTWMEDARAVRETCARLGVPAYVERSRSGEGAHVWFFFTAPVAASLARKLGSHVLTETMSGHPGLSFDSYDRLFPNQDTMPAGGFGNLIALPLQHEARQQGNSVFVETDWKSVRNQWSLLQRIERIEVHRVEALVKHASRAGTIVGVRTIAEDDDGEDEAPWLRSPSGAMPTPAVRGPLPESLHATLSQRLFVDKKSLPPALIAQIRRIAAFQNPEFYKKQAMHLSTWSTPRIICCAENLDRHVALPRGCAGDLEALAGRYHMALALEDIRSDGGRIAAGSRNRRVRRPAGCREDRCRDRTWKLPLSGRRGRRSLRSRPDLPRPQLDSRGLRNFEGIQRVPRGLELIVPRPVKDSFASVAGVEGPGRQIPTVRKRLLLCLAPRP